MSNEKNGSDIEMFFLGLADITRLRLLNLMSEGEICVYFLVQILGENQPKISRHLAVLRNAGIVEGRRQGKWIHYKIIRPADNSEAEVLYKTLDWLKTQKTMQQDCEKLAAVYRPENSLIGMQKAFSRDIFAEENMKKNRSKELEIFLL